MEEMPKGGARPRAGRKKEFDGLYQLKYRRIDRDAWERKAGEQGKILAVWIRETLNAAAPH